MKKSNQSTLFIIAGILFLISAVIGDTNYAIATIGFALITIGISKRKKESDFEDSEEGELLTDEEEKQVWEEYKGKVEDDENSTS